MQVATQWRVLTPVPADLHLANYITDAHGAIIGAWTDYAATDWYPPTKWRPGQTFWVQMHAVDLPPGESGRPAINLAVFVSHDQKQTGTPGVRLPVTLPSVPQGDLHAAENNTMLHLASVDASS